MKEVAYALLRFLRRHDISLEGVRIEIVFPTRESEYRAEIGVRKDMKFHDALQHPETLRGAKLETMMGLSVTLRSEEK